MTPRRWLDRVEAPRKGKFWFENSAHMPMIEEPGRALEALLKIRALVSDPDRRGETPPDVVNGNKAR